MSASTASLSSSTTPFSCPTQFGHFPDTHNCSRFYICNHGTSQGHECKPGLLFSLKLLTCDWARNVPQDQCGKDGLTVLSTAKTQRKKQT